MKVLYTIMIIAGLLLRYWINRRRFNRRSIAGVQIFKSYEHSYFVRIIEKVIGIIGLLMMVAGIIGLVA